MNNVFFSSNLNEICCSLCPLSQDDSRIISVTVRDSNWIHHQLEAEQTHFSRPFFLFYLLQPLLASPLLFARLSPVYQRPSGIHVWSPHRSKHDLTNAKQREKSLPLLCWLQRLYTLSSSSYLVTGLKRSLSTLQKQSTLSLLSNDMLTYTAYCLLYRFQAQAYR